MLADVFDYDVLELKLRRLAEGYKKRFGDLLKYDVEEELARFKVYNSHGKYHILATNIHVFNVELHREITAICH